MRTRTTLVISLAVIAASALATPIFLLGQTSNNAIDFSAYQYQDSLIIVAKNTSAKTVTLGTFGALYTANTFAYDHMESGGYPPYTSCTTNASGMFCSAPNPPPSLPPNVSYGWTLHLRLSEGATCPASKKFSKPVSIYLSWAGGYASKSVTFSLACQPPCGNGKLDAGETCDTGGKTDPGCTSKCKVTKGWTCTGSPSTCTKNCGNGKLDEGERCDLGGKTDSGCTTNCKVVKGWTCTGSPSTCAKNKK